ncbi:MAG: di-heme oxidoredictase family protein [Steroidobacteraceae bacterium]
MFTIAGRSDASGCEIPQPPLKQAWNRDNVSLRVPTPLFGLGLIEAISEAEIMANSLENMRAISTVPQDYAGKTTQDARQTQRLAQVGDRIKMYERLGIVGRPGRGRQNRSGNDSTITRFGWKAQNKSLLLFAGEAYNVEQGVTNELFPNERDEEATPLPDACKRNATPEDDINFELLDAPGTGPAEPPAKQFAAIAGDFIKFELFMRMLAPPRPACDLTTPGDCAENIVRGSAILDQVYCSACHVRRLQIGQAAIEAVSAQQYANLYSDLLLHKMGSCPPNRDHTAKCLADGISQGEAQGDEFRTAPLWGAGQRVFFLHDGRARDLPAAILAHKGPGSEANAVIRLYEQLPTSSKQDLIDFLRSL